MVKRAFLAFIAVFFAAGCGSVEPVPYEANPAFSDRDMAGALTQEGAFCNALANGESILYAHVNNLPPRGYKPNFIKTVRDLGYTERVSPKRKNFDDYRAAAREFGPSGSRGADMEAPER